MAYVHCSCDGAVSKITSGLLTRLAVCRLSLVHRSYRRALHATHKAVDELLPIFWEAWNQHVNQFLTVLKVYLAKPFMTRALAPLLVLTYLDPLFFIWGSSLSAPSECVNKGEGLLGCGSQLQNVLHGDAHLAPEHPFCTRLKCISSPTHFTECGTSCLMAYLMYILAAGVFVVFLLDFIYL